MLLYKIFHNHDDDNDTILDYYYPEGILIPTPTPPNTIWNSYNDCDYDYDDYNSFSSFLINGLIRKNLETHESIQKLFSQLIQDKFSLNIHIVNAIMKDNSSTRYHLLWDAYIIMLENITCSYHFNRDKVFQ